MGLIVYYLQLMEHNFGKWLILAGIILIALGAAFWIGIPIGRLPGDIHIQTKKTSLYIPITTCILLSLLFTLIAWLFGK